jgi:hypothetical protein
VKIAHLVLACLNGTNDFRKAENDDDRPDRPRNAFADDNIEKVRNMTRKDRRFKSYGKIGSKKTSSTEFRWGKI